MSHSAYLTGDAGHRAGHHKADAAPHSYESVKLVPFFALRDAYPLGSLSELASEIGGSAGSLLAAYSAVDADSVADSLRLSRAYYAAGLNDLHPKSFAGVKTTDQQGRAYIISPLLWREKLTDCFGVPKHLRSEADLVHFEGILFMAGVHGHVDRLLLWHHEGGSDPRLGFSDARSGTFGWAMK